SGCRTKISRSISAKRTQNRRLSVDGETTMNIQNCLLKSATIASLALSLMTATPAQAHHSFDAEYDSAKPITLTGFVTKLDWNNPHAFVYIDTKDQSGVT